MDLATVATVLSATKATTFGEVPAAEWPNLEPAVDAAMDALLAMRASEGVAIARDLGLRLANLRGLVDKIAGLAEGLSGRSARRL